MRLYVQKGYRTFFGIRVYGQSAILQAPNSAVKLFIPDGLHGFVFGHIHTDVKSFLNVIPEDDA